MQTDTKVWELNVVPFKGQLLPPHLHDEIIAINEQEFNWSAEFTQNDFAKDHSEYYVLLNGQIMLGYVGIHNLEPEVTINTFFIDQELRRQGMATLLGNYVLDQLAFRGIRHLFLEVRKENHAARQLYRTLGFQELVVRPNYYSNPTDDGIIMQMELAATNHEPGGDRDE